jgi:hypothetical protein
MGTKRTPEISMRAVVNLCISPERAYSPSTRETTMGCGFWEKSVRTFSPSIFLIRLGTGRRKEKECVPRIFFHDSLREGEGIFMKEKKAPKRQRRPLRTKTEGSPHCWAMTPERMGPRLIPTA